MVENYGWLISHLVHSKQVFSEPTSKSRSRKNHRGRPMEQHHRHRAQRNQMRPPSVALALSSAMANRKYLQRPKHDMKVRVFCVPLVLATHSGALRYLL